MQFFKNDVFSCFYLPQRALFLFVQFGLEFAFFLCPCFSPSAFYS